MGTMIQIEPTQAQLGYAWNGHVSATDDNVGKTISVMPTEKQIGYHNGDEHFSADTLARLRAGHDGQSDFEVDWLVTKERGDAVPAPRIHARRAG